MDDLINRQVIDAKERTVVLITGTGVKSASLIAEVRAKLNASGVFKVSVSATRAWSPGLANDLASTLVTLNIGGQCFRGPALRVR